MKVFVAVILAIGSVSALGSGPYLPSGWRPQGPAFFLPGEVQKPAEPIKEIVVFETEASGSDSLREYGPPKQVSDNVISQGLPDVITDQTFLIVDDKGAISAVEVVAEENIEQQTEIVQELTTEAVAEEKATVAYERIADIELQADVTTALYAEGIKSEEVEVKSEETEVKSKIAENTSEVVEIKSEVTEIKSEVTEVISKEIELATEVAEVKAEIVEIESEVAETKSEEAEVVNEVSEVKNEVSEVKTDVSEVKTEVAEDKTEVAEDITKVAEIKSELVKSEEVLLKAEEIAATVESVEKLEQAVVQEVEAVEVVVQNIAEALVNLETEIKSEQVQSEAVAEIKVNQEDSVAGQVPEGFLEYGPPGFREYGPPKGDELLRSAAIQEPANSVSDSNEVRRRRFSPKLKTSKSKSIH